MVDFRPVFFIIGVLLSIVAVAMLLPALVDIATGHPDWSVFVAAAAVTLFVGVALLLTNKISTLTLNLRQAFLLTSLSWVVIVAFAALPFTFASLGLSYTDGFFEAMSGLTTTGSTVIVGLDSAPPGILLWRALLQWIGGIGIIAVAIAILPALRIGGMQLFRLESSDKSEKVMPRAPQIAAGIGIIYLTFTVTCALLYWIGGMSGLDACIHAMTTVSTGGFSSADSSFGKFDSVFINLVAIVFMLLGGMTFTLLLRIQQGDWRALIRDTQTQWYLGLAVSFTLAIALWHWARNGAEFGYALHHAAFNVVSILTTTGYASTDYSLWGPLPVLLIFLLTFVGGCSGSTSGAIKIFRFQVLVEIGRSYVRGALAPNGVFIPKYNRRQITESVMQSVLAFIALYLFTFAVAAAALALCGLDLVTALSGSATALANVGPGLGEIIGPAGTFKPLPDAAKWIMSVTMLLGRLELVTVAVVLSRHFWRD